MSQKIKDAILYGFMILLLFISLIILIFELSQRNKITAKNKDLEVLEKSEASNISNTKDQTTTKKERIYIQKTWEKRYFIDEWGDHTDLPYITNIKKIHGIFSNYAVDNRKLEVFLIFEYNYKQDLSLSIFLHPYGESKVTATEDSPLIYSLYLKSDTKKEKISCFNFSDRINFDEAGSKLILETIKNSETARFRLTEVSIKPISYNYFGNEYIFEIDDIAQLFKAVETLRKD